MTVAQSCPPGHSRPVVDRDVQVVVARPRGAPRVIAVNAVADALEASELLLDSEFGLKEAGRKISAACSVEWG